MNFDEATAEFFRGQAATLIARYMGHVRDLEALQGMSPIVQHARAVWRDTTSSQVDLAALCYRLGAIYGLAIDFKEGPIRDFGDEAQELMSQINAAAMLIDERHEAADA
jgi:hypothetical protein